MGQSGGKRPRVTSVRWPPGLNDSRWGGWPFAIIIADRDTDREIGGTVENAPLLDESLPVGAMVAHHVLMSLAVVLWKFACAAHLPKERHISGTTGLILMHKA